MNFNKQVERNLEGIRLEREKKVDEAIELYEENINECFEGNHPYDRLALIYRKNKRVEDEARVLKKAIEVFEDLLDSPRSDVEPKLEKFKND